MVTGTKSRLRGFTLIELLIVTLPTGNRFHYDGSL